MRQPKVILVVMDGFGYSLTKEGNAVLNAKKPTYDFLWNNFPHTLLSASGEEVGLPWGELGGSEVGHLTIGSGRILYQNLPKITRAISDGSFFRNEFLIKTVNHAQKEKTNLHLVGLISSGGVHSHISHIEAVLKLVKKHGYTGKTFIHMITDGRDTAPKSAEMFLSKLEEIIADLKIEVYIATVSGRYYAMDRDNHWERSMLAYECMVNGKGESANSAREAIEAAYAKKETDEFIKPTLINGNFEKNSFINRVLNKKDHAVKGTIQDNDSIIFFNFRPDRMRQIVELFLFPRQDFPQKTTLKNIQVVTMTNYNESMPVDVAFPLQHVEQTLAKIISDNHLTQLHIAETEKYAHVTYFFNGGYPEPNPGEKWKLIPSPQVPTFNLKPEMSAQQITDYIIEENQKTPFDFVLINYANADMVGHSGDYKATIKAVETIDCQLAKLTKSFPESYFIICADHGNAEEMINPQTGEINTGHSVNPVPLIISHPSLKLTGQQSTPNQATAMIADLATTVTAIMGLPNSPEMTGVNLLESINGQPKPLVSQTVK